MNTSKRIISLILAIALLASMALTFSSCSLIDKIMGKDNQSDVDNNDDKEEEENKTPGDETDDPSTPTTPSTPTAPSVVTYTVTVKNAAGEVVSANVMLVGENYHIPGKDTDSQGKVTFEVTTGDWVAQLTAVPEGYTADLSEKYTFNENYEAVITLEAATAEAE